MDFKIIPVLEDNVPNSKVELWMQVYTHYSKLEHFQVLIDQKFLKEEIIEMIDNLKRSASTVGAKHSLISQRLTRVRSSRIETEREGLRGYLAGDDLRNYNHRVSARVDRDIVNVRRDRSSIAEKHVIIDAEWLGHLNAYEHDTEMSAHHCFIGELIFGSTPIDEKLSLSVVFRGAILLNLSAKELTFIRRAPLSSECVELFSKIIQIGNVVKGVIYFTDPRPLISSSSFLEGADLNLMPGTHLLICTTLEGAQAATDSIERLCSFLKGSHQIVSAEV